MVSPLGNTVESTWSNLIAGKSDRPYNSFDVKSYSTRFGGSIKDLDVDKYVHQIVGKWILYSVWIDCRYTSDR